MTPPSAADPSAAPPAPPGFDITRASHAVLRVADLDRARAFYEGVIGLIVTAAEGDRLYLRGIEEACHHSLVLERGSRAEALAVGFRLRNAGHLPTAAAHFRAAGLKVEEVAPPHQGPTLRLVDPAGVPVELCAAMPVVPRMLLRTELHRGGRAQRLDHFQLLTPRLPAALAAWREAGFRLTEWIRADDGSPRGVFLSRKGNPHDLVFFHGDGPRLHHVAFTAPELHDLIAACNAAAGMGYGDRVERGPGLHGPGHAHFVYIRDPDGHLVELFTTHYQIIDEEVPPVCWDIAEGGVVTPWGLPAPRRWFETATEFAATPVAPAHPRPNPMTAERWLGVDPPAPP